MKDSTVLILANENFINYCTKLGFSRSDIANSSLLSLKESIHFKNNELLSLETLNKFSVSWNLPVNYFPSAFYSDPITISDILNSNILESEKQFSEAATINMQDLASKIINHPTLTNPHINNTVFLETLNDLNRILQKLNSSKEN